MRTFAITKLLHSLRIKLRIVDDGIITDLAGDIDANETATPEGSDSRSL